MPAFRVIQLARRALWTVLLASACSLGAPAALWPAAAPAGRQAADAEVVLAALPAIRASLPPGRALLDATGLCAPRMIGWRCAEAVEREVREAGFDIGSRNFTLICPGPERSCRLLGTRALVVVDRVDLAPGGREARLTVSVWTRGADARRVTERRRIELALTRAAAGWETTDR